MPLTSALISWNPPGNAPYAYLRTVRSAFWGQTSISSTRRTDPAQTAGGPCLGSNFKPPTLKLVSSGFEVKRDLRLHFFPRAGGAGSVVESLLLYYCAILRTSSISPEYVQLPHCSGRDPRVHRSGHWPWPRLWL